VYQLKRKKEKLGYLNRDGGDMGMVIGNDNVIRQNDDVIVYFLGHALGTGRRQIQPHPLANREKIAATNQYS